jgi:hypothetical protein
MIPLGFEPLSVMLNDDRYVENKLEDLKAFWATAKKLAKQAKAIADCRNETLLIYFATDDHVNLRPKAVKKLGKIGRVIFGLKEDEVGHMSPQWSAKTEREVDEKLAAVLERKKQVSAEKKQACSAPDADPEACKKPAAPTDHLHKINVVKTERSRSATEKHTDMSLVEWWILGNAQWLATTRYSSYPATAAVWGMGPGGKMERVEIHGRPVFRTDWTRDDCGPARAADPAQAAACPNL